MSGVDVTILVFDVGVKNLSKVRHLLYARNRLAFMGLYIALQIYYKYRKALTPKFDEDIKTLLTDLKSELPNNFIGLVTTDKALHSYVRGRLGMFSFNTAIGRVGRYVDWKVRESQTMYHLVETVKKYVAKRRHELKPTTLNDVYKVLEIAQRVGTVQYIDIVLNSRRILVLDIPKQQTRVIDVVDVDEHGNIKYVKKTLETLEVPTTT